MSDEQAWRKAAVKDMHMLGDYARDTRRVLGTGVAVCLFSIAVLFIILMVKP